jgi:hypothetical protein
MKRGEATYDAISTTGMSEALPGQGEGRVVDHRGVSGIKACCMASESESGQTLAMESNRKTEFAVKQEPQIGARRTRMTRCERDVSSNQGGSLRRSESVSVCAPKTKQRKKSGQRNTAADRYVARQA